MINLLKNNINYILNKLLSDKDFCFRLTGLRIIPAFVPDTGKVK
jgi:hypothetical protein